MARRPRLDGADDVALATAARDGDRAALEELLRRHHDRVHAICRRMTGSGADAADATQEALIAVARGIRRYDGRAAFTTWLYRVTTNACIDELRRRARRPTAVDIVPERPDGAPGLAEAAVTRLDLDAAMRTIPEEYRAAVVLRDQLGLDYAEIADVLGIPAGTVRSRIARGRGALADRMAGNSEDPGGVQEGTP